ncbi:hypothetical protein MCHI_000840 [Candidatus Magnetoovum chiemensis]|nr:hypothetical protein MCHI_000840 [Candidatus Magnetoovum chiemensis]
MKRFLMLTLAALMLLGLSSFAFAQDAPSETAVVAKGQTKIEIGGEIRFRGEARHNTDYQLEDDSLGDVGLSGKTDDHINYFDTRVRLNVSAKVSDNVKGFVELETGDNTHDTFTWGGTGAAATGIYGVGNAKGSEMTLRQAWINYEKNGYGLTVGHQLLALGNSLFYDHTKYGDDAVLLYAAPTKTAMVGLLGIKHSEGDTKKEDDATAYVLLGSYKGSNWDVSGDITYVDFQQPTALGLALDYIHLVNFGLRGSVDVKPVKIRGDVELQTGKAKTEDKTVDLDVKGSAGLLGFDATLGPAVVTLEGAIGSGMKEDEDSLDAFVTSLGADPHYTYAYEYRVKSACDGMKGSGLCNTGYIKLGVKGDLIPKTLDGMLNIYWLTATEEVSLNGGEKSDELGAEIDAKVAYKFAKNLQYFVEGGYMFTGSAYDYANASADNAYMVRHGIVLKF